MKTIALWSGGKDSCLACYKAQQEGHHIQALVNFMQPKTGKSLSHGIPSRLIAEQAQLTGIPLIQREVAWGDYETCLKSVIAEGKKQGVEAAVFGDIYLKEHKEWLDRVCGEAAIRALYPLWGCDTTKLITEFIDHGFKTMVVAVREDALPERWLGRIVDGNFVSDLSKEAMHIDPCGESGEFHTFVLSGPLFSKRMEIKECTRIRRDGHCFLDISSWETA